MWPAEERPIKLAILTGMAAMFVLALCIPEAFDDLPGGLSGPVVLAVCYLLFRAMHLVMYLIISRDDAGPETGAPVRAQRRREQCLLVCRSSRDGCRRDYGCSRCSPTM